MNNYADFEATDFAQDDYFLEWVKYPDRDNTRFWTNWMKENPHKRDEIEEARRMIMAVLYEDQHLPSTRQGRELWERVEKTIEKEQALTQPTVVRQAWFYRIAATMLVLATVAGVLWYGSREESGFDKAYAEDLVEHANTGTKPVTITLADGSSVILKPGSSIHYPKAFAGARREVYLEGEAFFEVTKNPQRPFLVYANEVVTKVVGTSFTIRCFEHEPDIKVEVKTGKVSVFTKHEIEEKGHTHDPHLDGLVLTPNQQAIYIRKESKLIKSIVDDPSVLMPIGKESFEFRDRPMKEVFAVIERAYGIKIIYDSEVMENCYLNASLATETLKEKLSLICKAVNATYEVVDSNIIIYGKGCNE